MSATNPRDKLPEGAIVNCEVVAYSYLDPDDGELKYSVWFDGDVPLTTVLGLLDVAKHDLIERTLG